ncbi:hypothetical protein [Candidatus Liberibacter sp.]|uniref:hypothetical protein n=1 Tax=Candidatus Liberibacter sp. TaxID=34022 RepID=UPI002175062C|nr:hypothetical protein [Candidatus Liberibacter sp.]
MILVLSLEKRGSALKREEEARISVLFDSLRAARLVVTDELLCSTLAASENRCLVRD